MKTTLRKALSVLLIVFFIITCISTPLSIAAEKETTKSQTSKEKRAAKEKKSKKAAKKEKGFIDKTIDKIKKSKTMTKIGSFLGIAVLIGLLFYFFVIDNDDEIIYYHR